MRRIKDFVIIQFSDEDEFNKKIQNLISKGYRPLSNVISFEKGNREKFYIQVWGLYEEK